MLRPEDIMMAVTATLAENNGALPPPAAEIIPAAAAAAPAFDDDDIYDNDPVPARIPAPAAHNHEHHAPPALEGLVPTPDNPEVKHAVERIQKFKHVDFFQSDAALSWLCDHRITLIPSKHKNAVLMDCVHKLNYAPNTDDIIIHFKSREDHAAFKLELLTLMKTHLKRDVYAESEFRDVLMLNPDFLAGLCGFRNVVCDRDSVSNSNDVGSKLIPFETEKFSGNLEVKLPYFLMKHGPKILAYICRRLEKHGFSPALFENTEALPTLEELLLTLPDMPKEKIDYATQTLFDKYEKLGIFRLQESQTALGFIRVLTDSLERMVVGLRQIASDPGFARQKLEEALIPSVAIAINPMLMMQMIASVERSKGIKPAPHFRLGNPVHLGKQVLLPTRIEVPHSHNLISRATLTIIICDVSGSMANTRNKALITAAVDQCEQLALLPNQMVCGVKLGTNGGTIQEPTALNRITLPKILENFKTLSASESTNILPTLRDVKTHIDKADPKMDIQVLLITDGEFQDHSDAQIVSIMSSHRKVVWRSMGIDLREGGSEERNLKFILSQGETQSSQLVFCPAAEVKVKMEQLIAKTVPISLLKEVSMNIPLGGNDVWTQIAPFSLGMPVFRHIPVPWYMLEVAQAMSLQNVPIRLKLVNRNGHTQILEIAVPYLSFVKTQAVSEFNALYFCQEWLHSRCLTDKLGNPDSLSDDALLRLYSEASELELTSICKVLNERLEKHLSNWILAVMQNTRSGSKRETLTKLKALFTDVSTKNQVAYRELLQPEVDKLTNDPELFLEGFLFKELKVNTSKELAEIALDSLYIAYQKAWHSLTSVVADPVGPGSNGDEGLKLPEGTDIKAFKEKMLDKMAELLCQIHICQAAGIKLLAEDYKKLDEDGQRVAALLQAHEKALIAIESAKFLDDDLRTSCLITLKQRIDALWVRGQFAGVCTSHTYEEREKLSPALLLTYLRVLKDKAEAEGRASQSRLLTYAMHPVWMDGTLCLYINGQTQLNLQTKEQFNQCNVRLRFLAYQHAMEEAGREERQAIHQQLVKELEEIWLEGALCVESKQDSMEQFQKLPVEQQMQFYARVEENARGLNREKDVQEIANRVGVLEDTQLLFQAAKAMQVKVVDLKAFMEQPLLEKVKVLQWAQLTAGSQGKPANAKRLLARLQAEIEASQMPEGADDKLEAEVDRLLVAASNQSDFNQLISDTPVGAKLPLMMRVAAEERAKGNEATASAIEDRMKADEYIASEIAGILQKYVNEDVRLIEAALNSQARALAPAPVQAIAGPGAPGAGGGRPLPYVLQQLKHMRPEEFTRCRLDPISNALSKASDGLRSRYVRRREPKRSGKPGHGDVMAKVTALGNSLCFAQISVLEQVAEMAVKRFGKGSKMAEIILARIDQRINHRMFLLLAQFVLGARNTYGEDIFDSKTGLFTGLQRLFETQQCVNRHLGRIRHLLDKGCLSFAYGALNFQYSEDLKRKEEEILIETKELVKEVAPAAVGFAGNGKVSGKSIKNVAVLLDQIKQEFTRDPNGGCQNLVITFDEKSQEVTIARKAGALVAGAVVAGVAVAGAGQVAQQVAQDANIAIEFQRVLEEKAKRDRDEQAQLVQRLQEAQKQLVAVVAPERVAGVAEAAENEPKPEVRPVAVLAAVHGGAVVGVRGAGAVVDADEGVRAGAGAGAVVEHDRDPVVGPGAGPIIVNAGAGPVGGNAPDKAKGKNLLEKVMQKAAPKRG